MRRWWLWLMLGIGGSFIVWYVVFFLLRPLWSESEDWCAFNIGVTPPPEDDGTEMEWRWSEEKETLDYCIKQHLPDYEVEFDRKKRFYTPFNIWTKNDRKMIYSLEEGHENIVFTRWEDILYIAEYCPIASGCVVVALDLKTGEELWRSRLYGIGSTMHSEYRNLVNIETDGQRLIVNGNEGNGRYVEHLDLKTGKTLANKKLKADPEPRHGQ
jgi:outer membrane protein assembly factor BamB